MSARRERRHDRRTDRAWIGREIDEEIAFHFEMRVRENLAAGMSRQEAEESARARLGEVDKIKQAGRRIRIRASRSSRLRRLLDELRADVRFAVRNGRRSPVLTAVAIVTLALGIGANTAMFSVLNAVVLRPLAYRDPDDIVLLSGWGLEQSALEQWRGALDAADPLSLITLHSFDLTGVSEPQLLRGMTVTAGFFEILGVPAVLGRTLGPDDHRPDATPAVVIGHDLWQRLSADPAIVGSTLVLDGSSFVVAGVMPPGFRFARYADIEVWAPMEIVPSRRAMALARLAPGASLDALRAQAVAFGETVEAPARDPGYPPVRVERLRETVIGEMGDLIVVLSCAVAFVLLIACANVAQLLLSKVSERQRELGIRAALGAGRIRLGRQMLTESVLLAATGGALGLLLASWLLPVLLALRPGGWIPRFDETSIDGVVLGVMLAATLATGVLFGLGPVVALRDDQLTDALRAASSRGATGGHRRLRDSLVVAEVAIAMVLVIGTGLFIRTFRAMLPSDPGFAYEDRLTLELDSSDLFPEPAARGGFYRQLVDDLNALPGIEGAAVANVLPFGPYTDMVDLWIDERAEERAGRALHAAVSPGYFDLLEIPLLRGRNFTEADASGPPTALINATMAARLWPADDPLGRQFGMSFLGLDSERTTYTVIGVVQDAQLVPWNPTPRPAMWSHYRQIGSALTALVAKTRQRPATVFPAVRDAVRRRAPDLPVIRLRSFDEVLSSSVVLPRFVMLLMTGFGGTALLLALVGLFGVISYGVTRRTRELGVRVALGARSRAILTMVLREALTLVTIGAALGLGAALALGRFVEAWLVGVEPSDPVTYGAVTALIVVVAVASCLRPALRAARIDPLVALRAD